MIHHQAVCVEERDPGRECSHLDWKQASLSIGEQPLNPSSEGFSQASGSRAQHHVESQSKRVSRDRSLSSSHRVVQPGRSKCSEPSVCSLTSCGLIHKTILIISPPPPCSAGRSISICSGRWSSDRLADLAARSRTLSRTLSCARKAATTNSTDCPVDNQIGTVDSRFRSVVRSSNSIPRSIDGTKMTKKQRPGSGESATEGADLGDTENRRYEDDIGPQNDDRVSHAGRSAPISMGMFV